jgi:uncharacterized membrane protein YphA (DoxX/SURF4 family)
MDMNGSTTHPAPVGVPFDLPAWKTVVSTVCAVLLAVLFLVAGTWKITDPLSAATRMTQALVPPLLSLPLALALGIGETFAGVLLVVPRLRRWGAWIAGLMLVAFLVYFAIFYNQLRGEECNCFPWIKRAVGPAFFVGDFIMLALAAGAGWWAKPSQSRRGAALILGAVCVYAAVSYGMTVARQSGIEAPDSITVNGAPYSLQHGRHFIYFFDPECAHCDQAARAMAKLDWKDTKVVVVSTRMPQFTGQFLASTGLMAGVSEDLNKLRETFTFVDAPYAVAIEHGRQVAAFPVFDEREPAETLRRIDFIE